MADIGCSAGFISDELAEAGAAQVAGIDIDIPCLGKAQERFGKRVSFVCGDGERLPFRDGSFDAIVFNHIYEHVVDPDAVVRELHRVPVSQWSRGAAAHRTSAPRMTGRLDCLHA